MNKEAIVIPGNHGHVFDGPAGGTDYGIVVRKLKEEGFGVRAVEIDWSQAYPDWTDAAIDQIGHMNVDLERTALIGFSFGSLIALGVSGKVATKGLVLGSLSPHGGRKDMDRFEAYLEERGDGADYLRRTLSVAQYEAFERLDVLGLARRSQAARSVVVYGSNESQPLKERCQYVAPFLQAELIEIPGVGHDIEARPYVAALASQAAMLLK